MKQETLKQMMHLLKQLLRPLVFIVNYLNTT